MTTSRESYIDGLRNWTAFSVKEAEIVCKFSLGAVELKAYIYLAAKRFPLKDNAMKLVTTAGYTYIGNGIGVSRSEAARAVKGLLDKGLLGKIEDYEYPIEYPQEHLSYAPNCYTFPVLDAILEDRSETIPIYTRRKTKRISRPLSKKTTRAVSG